MVEALELTATDQVVEVGPGLGALTVELASRARAVVGVEIDPACVKALGLVLRDHSNVRIVEANILQAPVADFLPAGYRVAGNVPYNLTGALFTHLLEQPRPPRRIDLLVQQEVAERIVARPGGWSLATLGVRVYGQPELVLRVRSRGSTRRSCGSSPIPIRPYRRPTCRASSVSSHHSSRRVANSCPSC